MNGEDDSASQLASKTSPNPFPTPASITTGLVSFAAPENESDAEMTESRPESIPPSATDDVTMMDLASSTHSRTDHDRINPISRSSSGGGLDAAAEGSLLKLCENPLTIPSTHPGDNLIEKFGLTGVMAAMARKDPVTGEKINKLRKSYEGKVKELKIAGEKNKSNSKPGELLDEILHWPKEEWYTQKVHGKEMEKLQSDDLMQKLDRALQMAPGKIPKTQESRFRTMVGDGLDKPKPVVNGVARPQGTAPFKSSKPGVSAVPSPSMRPTRPERSGAKRSYDDISFTGYGEGFADDGESTGAEGDARSGAGAKKKRRKEYGGPGTPIFSSSSTNYHNMNRVAAGGR